MLRRFTNGNVMNPAPLAFFTRRLFNVDGKLVDFRTFKSAFILRFRSIACHSHFGDNEHISQIFAVSRQQIEKITIGMDR